MLRLMFLSLLGLFVTLVPPASTAATIKDYHFPDELRADGQKLILNGMALKEVSIFSVDVYLVGLYVGRRTRDWRRIVDGAEKKIVKFRFARNVGRSTLLESWIEDLQESCRGECKGLLRRVRAVVGPKLPDVKVGQEMDYAFDGKGMTLSLDGKPLASLPGSSDARAILAALVGDNAPSQELRQALLGDGRI